jgi:hypothetical protein
MVNAQSPAYSQGTPVPAPAASPVLPSTSPAAASERPRGAESYDATESVQNPSSTRTRPAEQYPSAAGVEHPATSHATPSSTALQEKDKIIFELLQLVKMKDSELSNLAEEVSLLRREMQDLSAEVKLYRRGFQPEVAVAPSSVAAGGSYPANSVREEGSRVLASDASVGGGPIEPIGVVGTYNPARHQGGTTSGGASGGFGGEQRFPAAGNGVVISGGSAYAFHHQAESYQPAHQENHNSQTPFATPSQLSALHVDFDTSRVTVEPVGDGRTPPRGQPVVVYQPYQNGVGAHPTAYSAQGHVSGNATSGLYPRPTPITPNREEVMRMVEDHERQVQRVLEGVENAKLRVAHRKARGKETDEYLLDAGSFRVRDSKTPIIAQAVGQRRLTPEAIKAADLSNLTPRRQVELYGAVTRTATPGPATYSPLWNRLATPKRTASPKRK